MVTLSPGKVHATDQPVLLVENALSAGSHRFRLTVVDGAGNESDPAELVLSVAKPQAGTQTPPIFVPPEQVSLRTLVPSPAVAPLQPRVPPVTPAVPLKPVVNPPDPVPPTLKPTTRGTR